MVFGDASRRRALNGIMAGHIAKAMALQCLWHFAIGTAVIILDVPLLYETGVHRACTPARLPLLGICAAKTDLSILRLRFPKRSQGSDVRAGRQRGGCGLPHPRKRSDNC